MDIELIISIIALLLSIILPLLAYSKNRREFRNYYSIIWENSQKIKPQELLGERPYKDFYFRRSIDEQIMNAIEKESNVLIVGAPLSGKTRAVFNAFKTHRKKFDVLVPRSVSMPNFTIPVDYKFWRKNIIFIDDLQYYIEKQDSYHLLFKTAKQKNFPIIATCHSGTEYKNVKNKVVEHNMDIELIFGDNIFEMPKLSQTEAREISDKLSVNWDKVVFNGTVGSLFMRLREMERRFETLDEKGRTILRTLQNLYLAGISDDNNVIRISWIKKAARQSELEGKEFEWMNWLKTIEEKEFIKILGPAKIWAEEAYLEYVIKPEAEMSRLNVFENAVDAFADDPSVLQMIGDKAYEYGIDDAMINEYIELSIKAYKLKLKLIENSGDKEDLLKVKSSLGHAYRRLSESKDTFENAKASLGYLTDMLNYVTRENNPYEYARIKMKMGNTYRIFTFIENIEENSMKAIEAYNEALEIFTLEDNPMDIAETYNVLGGAYDFLAETKDHILNCKKALKAFEEARRIRDITGYPKNEGFTMFNTATTYMNLSSYEDRKKNLAKAIDIYNELLTKKISAPLYGNVMNNLGYAYSLYSDAAGDSEYLKKAVESYNKALETTTKDQMPVYYSETMYNLGEAYYHLSNFEDKRHNLKEAKESLEEALMVKEIKDIPKIYSGAKSLLGKTLIELSELGENTDYNFKKGIEILEEASEIIKKYLPAQSDEIQKNIEDAKDRFKNKEIR